MGSSAPRPRITFSIVIPTHTAVESLEQCLASLAGQDFDGQGAEVFVVQDGGGGAAPRALERLNFPSTYLRQEHRGPAAARNLALRNAQGEIILFLDDDSAPLASWARALLKAWRDHPGADGIGGYTVSDPRDGLCCRVNSDLFNWYLDRHAFDDHATFLSTCNAGYTKAILDKVGGFDERFKKASGEDRDLSLRVLEAGGRLHLDKSILIYHDRDLTLRAFARKHFNYGAAAFELARRPSRPGRLSIRDYVLFYTSIIGKYRGPGRRLRAFLLLTLSQAATILGYQSGVWTSRRNDHES